MDLAVRSAWVDVIGAVNREALRRVGRSTPSRLDGHVAGAELLQRCFVNAGKVIEVRSLNGYDSANCIEFFGAEPSESAAGSGDTESHHGAS